MVGSPSRRVGRGREALPDEREEREALPAGWEGSGGYPGGPGKVGRHSWMARGVGSRWEAHLESRKVSEDPFVDPVRVQRPSRRARGGQEPRPRWPIEFGSPPRRAGWIGSLSRNEEFRGPLGVPGGVGRG